MEAKRKVIYSKEELLRISLREEVLKNRKLINRKLNENLIVYPGFQQDWYCFGPPESEMDPGQGGTIYQYDRITDYDSGFVYYISNAGTFDQNANNGNGTYYGLEFVLILTQTSAPAIGVNIPTPRLPTQRVGATLNTAYQPSTVYDTDVTFNMQFQDPTSLVAGADIQISTDSQNWVKSAVFLEELSIPANIIRSTTIRIPVGCYYKITENGTGTSVYSIFETQV